MEEETKVTRKEAEKCIETLGKYIEQFKLEIRMTEEAAEEETKKYFPVEEDKESKRNLDNAIHMAARKEAAAEEYLQIAQRYYDRLENMIANAKYGETMYLLLVRFEYPENKQRLVDYLMELVPKVHFNTVISNTSPTKFILKVYRK